jgi:hypothetical protein
VGGLVIALTLIVAHQLFPAPPISGPLWNYAILGAPVLLLGTYVWMRGDIDVGVAVALVVGGLSDISGLKLMVISAVALLAKKHSAPPFGAKDLAFIFGWGLILILVASKAIRDAWAGNAFFSRLGL